MSRGADVLAVLVPEVRERDGDTAVLLAEAGRVARALGGAISAVGLLPSTASAPALRPRPDVDSCVQALVAHVRETRPRVVLMLDGDLSRELAPRLAHACGSSALLGCTGVAVVSGATTYAKPVFGGWLEREMTYQDGSVEVVTLDSHALSVASATGAATPAAEIPITGLEAGGEPGASSIRRLEMRSPDYRTVDIVHAKRIVAAGMGAAPSVPATAPAAGSRPAPATVSGASDEAPADGDELLGLVRKLAALLEASTAATRPMVDEGYISKERLVGQTGRTVAPELYLALGISGSPHHVAGIQGAGVILAVDRDAAAPIFQFADAGYVAELAEILPALVRRIEEWRDGGD